MKRRSFLQAVGGAIAAVFAPKVAAEEVGRRVALQEFAAAFRKNSRVPPETVDELRVVIESTYDVVHEFMPSKYSGIVGRAPTAQPVGYGGPFYRGFRIAGRGATEKEAVADALNNITWKIGGKEMMWRQKLELGRERDFESNRSWVVVHGLVLVLR